MDSLVTSINGKTLVAGVGNALVDILSHQDDAFLTLVGAQKGGMLLVDHDFIEQTLSKTGGPLTMVPGGSACNTIVGIGRLGGEARFVGKCGQGKLARLLHSDLRKNGVDPILLNCATATGRCLSIITPDAQRSMFTFLGAAASILPQEISTAFFEDAAIVHIEGYLLHNKDLILATLAAARAAGALISLDLSSYTVVAEAKEILQVIVRDYVDILIANEDEARVFTGIEDERKALEHLAGQVSVAVVNLGSHGSLIAHGDELYQIPAYRTGTIVDTTGAGDLWAAGFLFGLVNNCPLDKCGRLGSLCAWEVCQVLGANIPDPGWRNIHEFWRIHGKKEKGFAERAIEKAG